MQWTMTVKWKDSMLFSKDNEFNFQSKTNFRCESSTDNSGWRIEIIDDNLNLMRPWKIESVTTRFPAELEIIKLRNPRRNSSSSIRRTWDRKNSFRFRRNVVSKNEAKSKSFLFSHFRQKRFEVFRLNRCPRDQLIRVGFSRCKITVCKVNGTCEILCPSEISFDWVFTREFKAAFNIHSGSKSFAERRKKKKK